MGKAKKEKVTMLCPVGRFFQGLEGVPEIQSEFFDHLKKARIEFLRAIRALVDERIEHIEKKASRRAKKRVTKIKVD